ncbi:MAG: insulinase family protein [Deltaproteobacteria bacterium]|nr:insulinase family protein [Deltaproteobacteria bacterium]
MKNMTFTTIAIFLLLGFWPEPAVVQAGSADLEVGMSYHGFKLLSDQEIKEIGARAKIFEHEKTGARLMKLECDDDNKVFSISFKTPPNGDYGIPHIMEHSVLNGSKKFPVKSPFDILVKGSLNTYLNAFTMSDSTMYPVASRNRKDFFNLMNVYLDAVLNPMIYDEPKIFAQEGWHYSLENKDAELKYNGIVYNEMKGAFSSPGQMLAYIISKKLFPDSPYGYSSGGYPEAIPELTQKTFLDFHRKYYHPSNSYIGLYGDGDLLEELKFINDNYLSKFDKSKADTSIALQKPFQAPKELSGEYPVASSESTQDKTYLSLDFVAGTSADPGLCMSFDVLSEVLVDLPASPMRKALLDAGIGKDVYATYDDIKQGVFSIVAKNANPEDKDKFKQVVFDTLKRVVKEGLDKKDIEGVINRKEFNLREADFGGMAKGLVYGYIALQTWMFADDPIKTLAYEDHLSVIRKALDSNYLESLIEKHLLNNPHRLLTVLTPKPGMEDEYNKKRKDKLLKIKTSFSDKEIEALVKQTQELKAYQTRPDKPEDLAKIPMLSLADLDKQEEKIELAERSMDGTQVLHFEHSTNGIIYLQLLFDAQTVPQELIPHAKLLVSLLSKLDTAKYDYGEADTQLNIHTGGLNFSLQSYLDIKDGKAYHPKLVASAKVLTPKFEKLTELIGEIITQTRFDNIKRLKEVINERNSDLQSAARGNGNSLATTRLASYLSQVGRYDELTRGLTHIHFVSQLAKDFDKNATNLMADLEMVAGLLFNKQNLIIGVTCSAEDYKVFEAKMPGFLAQLGTRKLEPQKYDFAQDKKNEGLLSASKVQYVVKGANFRDLGHAYSGQLMVLSQILSRDYLTQKIRVEAGAYGAWSAFGRSGLSYLASYRDPHLAKTLKTYDNTIDYLKKFDASETEMTRYIIGTISRRDRPKTASQKGRAAVSLYLHKISQADLQKTRDEILVTRKEDIRSFSKMMEDFLKNSVICVYGNEKKLKEHKKLFDELVKVID